MSALIALSRALRSAGGLTLDALLPPRCLSCGEAVTRPGLLCASCWEKISFLGPPLCAACGYPFEFELVPEAWCGACIRERPAFDRARAVMRYDDTSRRLLLGFKHGDRTEGAPAYGAWLKRAGSELLPDADVVAPVSLHPLRLLARRYNQAALLAHALARESGLPIVVDLLVRRRRTPPQGRLSATARQRNVQGAFVINPRRQNVVEGRRVLLIDDVITTGATVSACARALRRGGAAGVDVLTLARVVRSRA